MENVGEKRKGEIFGICNLKNEGGNCVAWKYKSIKLAFALIKILSRKMRFLGLVFLLFWMASLIRNSFPFAIANMKAI